MGVTSQERNVSLMKRKKIVIERKSLIYGLLTGSQSGTARTFDHKPPRPPQPNLFKLQNKKGIICFSSKNKRLVLKTIMLIKSRIFLYFEIITNEITVTVRFIEHHSIVDFSKFHFLLFSVIIKLICKISVIIVQ